MAACCGGCKDIREHKAKFKVGRLEKKSFKNNDKCFFAKMMVYNVLKNVSNQNLYKF
jgi:PP-loop superfamily ATP-utilizing enzyme